MRRQGGLLRSWLFMLQLRPTIPTGIYLAGNKSFLMNSPEHAVSVALSFRSFHCHCGQMSSPDSRLTDRQLNSG